MIKDLTFFDNCEGLEKLTGLTYKELWDAGFNLDDMDWGFCSDEKYVEKYEGEYGGYVWNILWDKIPRYASQLLHWMEDYCVGFCYVEYDGKHYYTLHHA